MLNKYPLWKNLLLAAIVLIGLLYAVPNMYTDTPAIQISATAGEKLNESTRLNIQNILTTSHIAYRSMEFQQGKLLIRYADTDAQLKAKDLLQSALGDHYIVALNLAPATPAWLRVLGAE